MLLNPHVTDVIDKTPNLQCFGFGPTMASICTCRKHVLSRGYDRYSLITWAESQAPVKCNFLEHSRGLIRQHICNDVGLVFAKGEIVLVAPEIQANSLHRVVWSMRQGCEAFVRTGDLAWFPCKS